MANKGSWRAGVANTLALHAYSWPRFDAQFTRVSPEHRDRNKIWESAGLMVRTKSRGRRQGTVLPPCQGVMPAQKMQRSLWFHLLQVGYWVSDSPHGMSNTRKQMKSELNAGYQSHPLIGAAGKRAQQIKHLPCSWPIRIYSWHPWTVPWASAGLMPKCRARPMSIARCGPLATTFPR